MARRHDSGTGNEPGGVFGGGGFVGGIAKKACLTQKIFPAPARRPARQAPPPADRERGEKPNDIRHNSRLRHANVRLPVATIETLAGLTSVIDPLERALNHVIAHRSHVLGCNGVQLGVRQLGNGVEVHGLGVLHVAPLVGLGVAQAKMAAVVSAPFLDRSSLCSSAKIRAARARDTALENSRWSHQLHTDRGVRCAHH